MLPLVAVHHLKALAAAYRSVAMKSTDLNDWQRHALRNQVQRISLYLTKLRKRMLAKGFRDDDSLFQAVTDADSRRAFAIRTDAIVGESWARCFSRRGMVTSTTRHTLVEPQACKWSVRVGVRVPRNVALVW